jgi:hypothetical protein
MERASVDNKKAALDPERLFCCPKKCDVNDVSDVSYLSIKKMK